jgi:hypothetical protein
MTNGVRNIFIAVLALAMCIETFAQGGGGYPLPYRRAAPSSFSKPNTRFMGNNKLPAIKKAYINQQMSLTSEEAERFWPVYDRYQTELENVFRERRQNNQNSANDLDQLNKDLYYEQKLVQIRKKYRDEFLRILPADKVAKLYQSEREFKNELIRHLREHSK